MRLLSHPEERVRLVAAKQLAGYAGQPRLERRLVAAFRAERSPHVRAWILYGLRGVSIAARAQLARALRADPAPAVRIKAAQRMSEATFSPDAHGVDALLHALATDEVLEVRRRAAEALGRLEGRARVEAALRGCLDQPHLGAHCALGLGRLGSRRGYVAVEARVRAALQGRPIQPLFVWGLVEFAGASFFDAAGVRRLLGRLARSPRQPKAVRQYAVNGLGRLARAAPTQRRATRRALAGFRADPDLAVSAELALAALRPSATVRPSADQESDDQWGEHPPNDRASADRGGNPPAR
jgi:hypothetical protein